jgi:parallel beta-helix repeat protein
MIQRQVTTAILFATIAMIAPLAHAADRWVDASYTGSVSTGSSTQPFKTITLANAVVQPGDTVRVRPGVYNESVWIVGGTSNAARVTYKSEVKWGAKIVAPVSSSNGGCFNYWGGNAINNVNDPSVWGMNDSPNHKIEPRGWVTIDGFDLHSNKTDSTGTGTWFQWVHHVTIRNCWAHNNAMHGLGASLSDYIVIENNIVNDNAVGSGNGNDTLYSSGISNWKVRPWDNAAGFHNTIRNNVVFNNHNDLTNPGRSDGSGIIMDTTAFDRGTLIENNLVVNNGGAGILLDGAANCTVRNNTLYQNAWDLSYPEIYATKVTWDVGLENADSTNAQLYNNLVVARTDRLAVRYNPGTGNAAHHNLRWYSGQASPTNVPAFYNNGGNLSDSTSPTDITGQDPQFVSPGTNVLTSDFHLQHYSAAINKNNTNTSNSKDLDGQPRSGTGNFVDLGAYEYQSFVGQPGFEGMSSLTAPYVTTSNGGVFYIDTNNGRQHVGSSSAGIWVQSGAGSRWNSVRQTLTGLAPNTTYTITAWTWDVNGTIGSGAYLGSLTTGGVNLGSINIAPSTGSYKKTIYTFNTGSLTSLLLSVGYNSPANQDSVFRIDDISVNQKTTLP